MSRKLFCQISPTTYKISVFKCTTLRHSKNIFRFQKIAKTKLDEKLPYLIYAHKSLIHRKLGDVDPNLQNNKAINLAIAAPKVSNITIAPGETFSFWSLVGPCSEKRGYKDGLTILKGHASKGIGGGICQFTNLIHWLVIHTPLEITEHHHHNGIDLFPDYGRQVPFGLGTSIAYNYLDYRFFNNTDSTFQLIVWLTPEYLCAEIRSSQEIDVKYHIKKENEYFSNENEIIYRNGEIYQECIDKKTGNLTSRVLIKKNHARVLYDSSNLEIRTNN